MAKKDHWESVYQKKASTAVSWFAPQLATSLKFIESTGLGKEACIIDVGGGASTLVDDLLLRGYKNVTVVDLAASALAVAQQRLGDRAGQVTWLAGDITQMTLPPAMYDIWHDRAVFHFLTDEADRREYIKRVCSAVKEGGYVIIATFGPHGPDKCSGLPVARYSAEQLHGLFGEPFQLVSQVTEEHATPMGAQQEFVYCCCRKQARCQRV